MATEMEMDGGHSPWPFLLGVSLVLGSALLFIYDLAVGNNVLRGLAGNLLGAAVLVAVAGWQTFTHPDSSIDSKSEAGRAIALMYGVYLLVAGFLLIGIGVVFHPDPRVGGVLAGIGGTSVIAIYLTGHRATQVDGRRSTTIGGIGVLLFVGSIPLFVYDLATGHDVFRSIVTNAAGAGVFVLWTVYDMPADPASGVQTHGEAAGVALLHYGTYLLVAGGVLLGTAPFGHAYSDVGVGYVAIAIGTLGVGIIIAPLDAILAASDGESED